MIASSRISRLTLICCIGCALGGVLQGCRGERSDNRPRQFFPGLDDQPKYRTQAESQFFEDGRTMRQPPEGVVAFGRHAELGYGGGASERAASSLEVARERASFLREDSRLYGGKESDGSYVDRIPMGSLLGAQADAEKVKDFVLLGQERFNIFCITCHGGTGRGDGLVGQRWASPIPSLLDPKYKSGGEKGQDGFIFWTIRNGVPNPPGIEPAVRMPSYSAQVNEYEAWAIVAYVRALQKSQGASIESAPAAERDRLLRNRPTGTSQGAAQ